MNEIQERKLYVVLHILSVGKVEVEFVKALIMEKDLSKPHHFIKGNIGLDIFSVNCISFSTQRVSNKVFSKYCKMHLKITRRTSDLGSSKTGRLCSLTV